MYFLFNPNRMIFEVSRLKNISGKLHGAAEDVISAERVLDPDTYQTVLDRLKLYGNNLCETGKRMDGLSQGLSLVRDEYFNTENRICGKEGAPDWLKLLGEFGDKASSLIKWLGGVLLTGNYDPDEHPLVTVGGRAVSFFVGDDPYIDSKDGVISVSRAGSSNTETISSVPGYGDITLTTEGHFLHYMESENNRSIFVNDDDNMYREFYEKSGVSLADLKGTTDIFGRGTVENYYGILNYEISSKYGMSQYVDGKPDQGLFAGGSLSGSVFHNENRAQIGNDASIEAEVDFLRGDLDGNFEYGRIVREDGSVVHGIAGGFTATANVAQVGASGSIDLGVVRIDVGAGLSAGVGGGLGFELTTGNVGGNISVGPVSGMINIELEGIEWTDLKFPEIELPDLSDWELPDWELPDLSDWELPDWELPDWELPDWELPDWMSW